MSETNNTGHESASFDPSPTPEFLREKIKQKPINKKKLLRKTLFTIMTAAIFGVVACATFLLLEPFFASRINAKETEKEIPTTTVELTGTEDEISPEDMYATDSEMIEEALQGNVADVNENIQNIENMISDIRFGIEDYQNLYTELRNMSDALSHSLVSVTGVTSNLDLLNNSYENNASVSGIIVADNGPSLIVLVKDNALSSADDIIVSFFDNTTAPGHILGLDSNTGMLVLAVNHSDLSDSTLSLALPASLGTSRSTTLKGSPIIALGSPIGIADSMAYGMITSNTQQIGITDSDCCLITTDIAGCEASSGVLVTLKGNVIGIIDNSFDNDPDSGLVYAIGITELKPLIERLSNSQARAYLGVQCVEITFSMMESYNLPDGIYLNHIELDSPAMNAGLQNGDILVEVDGEKPASYHDFIKWLYSCEPGSDVTIKVLRQSVNDYTPLTVNVTLGTIESIVEE